MIFSHGKCKFIFAAANVAGEWGENASVEET